MGTVKIPLTQGFEAIVDDEDAEWIRQWTWYPLRQTGRVAVYAKRNRKIRGTSHARYMHREIAQRAGMSLSSSVQVDHRDGNGLNNSRANLRIATPRENSRNSPARLGSSSFKGVFRAENGRWCAQINPDGNKTIHLGTFDTEEEAALAYDTVARVHHGEFARLNFPDLPLEAPAAAAHP